MNAALAVAMLRHQEALSVPDGGPARAMGWAEWPARLQLLRPGRSRDLLRSGAELWLDGGHNPARSGRVADFFRAIPLADRPFHIVFGLLADRDPPACSAVSPAAPRPPHGPGPGTRITRRPS